MAFKSIKTILSDTGVLGQVILSPEINFLLSGLDSTIGPTLVPGQDGIFTGCVELSSELSKSPIAGFDFALAAPKNVVDPAPYKIKLDPPENPTSFQFWLVLADQGQARVVFKPIKSVAGLALTGTKWKVAADGSVSLEALDPGDEKHDPVASLGWTNCSYERLNRILAALHASDGALHKCQYSHDEKQDTRYNGPSSTSVCSYTKHATGTREE